MTGVTPPCFSDLSTGRDSPSPTAAYFAEFGCDSVSRVRRAGLQSGEFTKWGRWVTRSRRQGCFWRSLPQVSAFAALWGLCSE